MKPRSLPLVVVAVAILLVALAGCSGPPDTSPSNPVGRPAGLIGTSWRVGSVGGRLPVAGAVPTATFSADRVAGSGGCNSYSGRYLYDPTSGEIQMRDLAMTSVACVEGPRNDFETVFFQALGQANLVSVDSQGRTALSGPGGLIVLEVDPQRAVEG
jgi:heat shock protein HslJ